MEENKNLNETEKYYKKARRLHKHYRGKIEIVSKCSVNSLDDFSHWYTPGVADPCKEIAKDPDAVFDYTNRGNSVAIISDGTRVLGLGNIGPKGALPVMEGKSLIFKHLGGVDATPLCVDTDNIEELVSFAKAVAPTFGGINLEDIETPKCFHLLKRLREEMDIPVWHDDRQGTATVILAGIFSALELVEKELSTVKIVLFGAGASNLAVADLLKISGVKCENIILVDSKGTLHKERIIPAENPFKAKWAKISNGQDVRGGVKEALKGADVLVALSTPGPGVIKPSDVKEMGKDAIVFACANPVPEIWPWEAKEAGAVITGTGRSDFPNQLNNSLVFPGLFRGTLDVQAKTITDEMCVAAARAITDRARVMGMTYEHLVPSMEDEEVAARVAAAVGIKAIESGLARKTLTYEEIYENARKVIKRSRDHVKIAMREGLIKPEK
jgi:malate dehydrogenase (oxaloacetate-decarboxylating)